MPAAALVLPAALGGTALGILLADAGMLPRSGTAVLIAGVGAVVVMLATVLTPARRRAALLLAIVVTAGLALGWFRGGATQLATGPTSVAALVDGEEHRLVGTVVDEPRPRGDRLQVVLDDVLAGDAADRATTVRRVEGRLLVWLPRGIGAAPGDRVRIASRLEEPRDFDGFAYRAYLARQGIGAIARVYSAEVVGRSIGPVAATSSAIRHWLLDGLNAVVPEPEAALGAGILLGVRSGIAPEIEDAFAAAGLTHVVAISGWNIAIVVGLVSAAAGPLARARGGRLAVPATVLATVGLYVLVTGASPSVVRAALMAGAIIAARLGGSRAHAASALMLAALVMLVVAPPILWDVGFQLSLLATAGLIVFGAALEQRLSAWPRLVREPVALTLAAQLTTLPVILLSFERLSLVAPAANVLVVPLVPLVMLTSAMAAVVGALDGIVHLPLLGDAATWLAGGSAWLLLRAMIAAGVVAAAVPFAAVDLAAPVWLAAAWYPAVALGASRLAASRPRSPDGGEVELVAQRRSRPWLVPAIVPHLARRALRPAPLAGALIALLAGISLASLPDGRLHLTVLDIGQGDAILVEAPSGATMLIDGGPDPDLTLRRLGEALPFFQRRIDILLLTHPHQDHVAGLIEVLRRYRVGAVLHAGIAYDNPAYTSLLEAATAEPRLSLIVSSAGQRIGLDAETSLEILYPSAGDAALPLPEGDINNGSVVALLRHGEFSVLLTGDAEAPVERLLLDRGLLGRVDVLKAGHHGSDSSTTEALLDAIAPRLVLISAGVDNEYGHPSAATLAALAERPGIVVRRTDLHGSIEVISDGHRYALDP